ncbi:hypothetical protein MHYP_G00073590 [Metynnis hypsauchen]
MRFSAGLKESERENKAEDDVLGFESVYRVKLWRSDGRTQLSPPDAGVVPGASDRDAFKNVIGVDEDLKTQAFTSDWKCVDEALVICLDIFGYVEKLIKRDDSSPSATASHILGRCDSRWTAYLSVPEGLRPSWRLLYISPLPERSGDLQLRIFHCALLTNGFELKFKAAVHPRCIFCNIPGTVVLAFSDCPRRIPLSEVLGRALRGLGVLFTWTQSSAL